MNYKSPLRPDRIRTIEKPFAWIPFRLLKDGLFAELSDNAKLLYTFLCLAADRQGLSYYGDPKIQTYFDLNQIELDQARKELIQKDLLAYDGHLYQLLSLPSPKPETTTIPSKSIEPESFSAVLKRLAEQSTR